MKEEDKTPEEELSEVEISNLHNQEFKVMIINSGEESINTERSLTRVRKQKEEPNRAELENRKKNQTGLKITATAM